MSAKTARYRLRLRYPDGREDVGAFRRFRPGSPRLGHAFATEPDGQPVSWEIVDEQLAFDAGGEPYLDLVAVRDFEEAEATLPDHELEHTLARRDDDELPEGAVATLGRAADEGLSVELVALEPGEEPDWEAAERFIDALILEEIDDDLHRAGRRRHRPRPARDVAGDGEGEAALRPGAVPLGHRRGPRPDRGVELPRRARLRVRRQRRRRVQPGLRSWLDVQARRQRGARGCRLRAGPQGRARSVSPHRIGMISRRWPRTPDDRARRGDRRRRAADRRLLGGGVVDLLGDDAYSGGAEDVPVNERMLPDTKLATVVRAFFLLRPVSTDDAVAALGRDAVESLEAAGLADVGDEVVPRARILPVDDSTSRRTASPATSTTRPITSPPTRRPRGCSTR